MENLSHTLCGLALARAGGDRLDPLATPVLVIGANLPDADILGALWGGRTWYLVHHRGVTHSLVGLAAESLLLAGAALLVGRWRGRRSSFRWLWLAAALGLASHLALDALNTYGVRPLLPFAPTWRYGDVAFIVDPWLWLGFGAAACLGAPALAPDGAPARRGLAGWVALTVLGAVFLLGGGWVPWQVGLAWTPAMAALVWARRAGVGRVRRHRAAWIGLTLTGAYLLALCGLSRVADARARAAALAAGAGPAEASATQPAPGTPWRFTSTVATARTLRPVRVDLLRGDARVGPPLARDLHDPALGEVAETPEYHAWRVFARLPFVARVGGRLILGDGRYVPRAEPAWCNLSVALPGPEAAKPR